MYVHVGENVMIRSNEIVAILDKDTVNTSEDIQVFLEKKKDLVSVLASGSFKSLVLTVSQIYLTYCPDYFEEALDGIQRS